MITLVKARELSLERLEELEPAFKDRVRQWLDEMYTDGKPVLITEGFRSIERSNQLVASGIFAAPGGKSYHNYGLAVDWVPLIPDNKALNMWRVAPDVPLYYEDGMIKGKKYCLTAISQETGHLQDSRYPTWREAKASRENKEIRV